jgi:hypothetical protein
VSLEIGSRTKLRPDRQVQARVHKGTTRTIATASNQCQTLATLGETINIPEIIASHACFGVLGSLA